MLDLIGRAEAFDFKPIIITPVSGTTKVSTIISKGLTWALFFAAALAVVYLIYGGILYITAGGDPEKATKGRTAVINAIIGIIIILLALVIVNWVANIFSSNPS